MIHLIHQLPGIGIGLAIGVFCPSLARKLKSYFSSNAGKVVSIAEAEAKAGEQAVAKKL